MTVLTRSPEFQLAASCPAFGIALENGRFLVKRGSLAMPALALSIDHGYAKIRNKLIANNVLVAVDGLLRFERDVVFRSPSTAASVVAGSQRSGFEKWKIKGTRISYGEWLRGQATASQS